MKTPLATLVLLALLSLPLAAQRTRPVDVSVQGFQARPYCPPAMDDLAGGGCMPASSTPMMGALYPLSIDFNLDPATGFVGLGTTAPTERLHLNGNLGFKKVDQGLVFNSNNPFFATSAPMMTMFTSGFTNLDRMVIGHSLTLPNYGLAYEDDEDRFVFQSSPSSHIATLDMADRSFSVHDQNGDPTLNLDGRFGGSISIGALGGPGFRLIGLTTGGAFFGMRENDGSAMMEVVGDEMVLYSSVGVPTISYNRQTGAKNAVVRTEDHGQRLLYNEESTEVWFTDHGSGRLADGQVRIELDPVFLQTVIIDADHPMRVFVTMTAESMPVWVEKGTESFVVHEQLDGESDATFDYRVMAKRRGLEDARLEPFEAD